MTLLNPYSVTQPPRYRERFRTESGDKSPHSKSEPYQFFAAASASSSSSFRRQYPHCSTCQEADKTAGCGIARVSDRVISTQFTPLATASGSVPCWSLNNMSFWQPTLHDQLRRRGQIPRFVL